MVAPAQEDNAFVTQPLKVVHPSQLGGVLLLRVQVMDHDDDRQFAPWLLPGQLQQKRPVAD